MARDGDLRLAILSSGDSEARRNTTTENSRFADLFRAFGARRVRVEPAIYHDDFCDEVREQLMQVDGILVWVNPIEGGRDRSMLDSMLRDVAAGGVFVSAHPDVILKLGTKEVLYRTRDLGWGCDTHLYASLDQMVQRLPLRLANGKARVLKQQRGNGGNGVWKVQLGIDESANRTGAASAALPQPQTVIHVRHALRGCTEEEITFGEFYHRCEPYFYANGLMIDQEYQERLPEGMIRCYLVHDNVVGFGHQAINALFPAPPEAPSTEAPPPRTHHLPAAHQRTRQSQPFGASFFVDQNWPHRLVRAEVNLNAGVISFYALRRREPAQQPLLRTVEYRFPDRRFSDRSTNQRDMQSS